MIEVLVATTDKLADGVTCRRPRASPLDFPYARMHGVRRVDNRRNTEAIYMARSKGNNLNVGNVLRVVSCGVGDIQTSNKKVSGLADVEAEMGEFESTMRRESLAFLSVTYGLFN